jgi:hypothetical protein
MIYQWKVEIAGIQPLIWRRFQTFGDITFDQLHKTLQTVIGWEDYHLYLFGFPDKTIHIPNPEFPQEAAKELDARKEKVRDHITEEGQNLVYLYDFGDNWEHELLLEKIVPQQERAYPVCLEGEHHCPPEDAGGIHGYIDILEILQNENHPEYEDTLLWIGERFNPKAFNKEIVNRQLRRQENKLNPKQAKQNAKRKKSTKLAVPSLRKQLQNLPQEELIRMVIDCVKASKEAEQFFTIQLVGEEALGDIIEEYRKKVKEEFFPARGEPKLRLSEARKAIREFEKLAQDKRYILDLRLFYVELGVEFTNLYGDIDERFYNSMLSMYDSAARMLSLEDDEELMEEFQQRMRVVVEETAGMGWGFHDTLNEIYADLFAS